MVIFYNIESLEIIVRLYRIIMDELRSLSIFAKTVEMGSFRAAAKAFNLSPSVVSYHISQLEERYNIALLYRSTRKLSLTAEGKQLYEHASAISRAAEECFNVLARESETPVGRLVISAPAVLIESRFSEHIARFVKRFPKVQLSINYTDARQDLIAEGIDVAIRIGAMPDSNLKSKRIASLHRQLVCSPEYYQTKPAPDSPEDLYDWDWINLSMLPASRVFNDAFGTSIKTENKSSLSVNSVSATCQLSIRGLGLASPPDFMVEAAIKSGQLLHVLPDWSIDDLDVYAIWPENVKRKSIVDLFVENLTETD